MPGTTLVQGATGTQQRSWTANRKVDLGRQIVTHSFLVMPDCPYEGLLGRDLLQLLKASIKFDKGGFKFAFRPDRIPTILITVPLQEEGLLLGPDCPETDPLIAELKQEFPTVWAENHPFGGTAHRVPVVIELKAGACPIQLRQYPMNDRARRGITPHIERLLKEGILDPCHSPWNTPLLPVKKPNSNDYRPVQDLRAVNDRVADIHPAVPNPYTLLSLLLPQRKVYSVLDLKDAFFSIPLAPVSQPLFAFEWTNEKGQPTQLTWTRLPQGFKNSPTLFSTALRCDLQPFHNQLPEVTLLQYVDDLLIAGETFKKCLKGTKGLVKLLQELGYKISTRKAQICRNQVTYLGYILKDGQRWLGKSRTQAILALPEPKTRRELREFLGTAGYCHLWIPRFAELAKPLYEALKGTTIEIGQKSGPLPLGTSRRL